MNRVGPARARGLRVVMLLENNAYPSDVRVRNEAQTLVGAGHEVTVIAPRGPGQARGQTVAGVSVERFWMPRTADTPLGFLVEYGVAHVQLLIRAAVHLLRGADVVHAHNPPDTLFPAFVLAAALGRGAVYDHHDDSAELFAQKFGRARTLAILTAARRISARRADLVIVTNESQAELLRPDAGPAVTVVRNGPLQGTLRPDAPRRPGQLTDPHIVYLGSLGAQDGVDELPELLRRLRADGIHGARMTVVGDGPRREPLAAAFAREGLSEAVKLTGWVDHRQVPDLVAQADVCVDPAPCSPLNHGSTMIKVAEYMAAARPVVAYDLVETRRTAGDAALYAGCGDAVAFAASVARLAREPELRVVLGEHAATRARGLVWERSAAGLVAAYEELARRHVAHLRARS